jgi:molybdate transport system substrate-binding protein
LTLTLSGLFGVLSYLVEQRTKEIGVRMALGATMQDVTRLVLSQSIRPVGIGLLVGGGSAAGLAALLLATPAAAGLGLIVISDLPTGFLRRLSAGEHFDLLISGSVSVDEWIRDGRLLPKTRTEIARSGIGVEVRAGSAKPDISTVDAFKRALLNAKSIAYLRVGSGLYLHGLFESLGLSKALESKVTRPDSDIVSELVAKGEVELGMTVITQILTTPGVDLVGPLPREIQSYVIFVAAVAAQSKTESAANELIKFLKGPRAISVMSDDVAVSRRAELSFDDGMELSKKRDLLQPFPDSDDQPSSGIECTLHFADGRYLVRKEL